MKSSILLAATGAALAIAGPVEKRVIETDIVVDYFTVTVTGEPPHSTTTSTTQAVSTTTTPTQAATTQAPPVEKPSEVKAAIEKPAPTTQPVVVVTVTAGVTPETTQAPTQAPAPATVVSKPSPVVEAVATESSDSFQSEALFHHNIHRSNHSAPAMTWDDQIAGWAAITAAKCVFAHDMSEGDGNYGQNIALWGVSSGAAALGETGAIKMAATNMWYDGEFNAFLPSYYGESTPDMSNFEAWGHLSQMLWSGSISLGCAVKFCPAGTAYSNLDSWFSVCNYFPPGNVGGEYGENINRPLGQPSVTV
ncbi:CAP domain-containing protein [Xylaria sp. CBS 124048]|nr:CAP domain-containing protein [Xylaria sp. CBS 124048]